MHVVPLTRRYIAYDLRGTTDGDGISAGALPVWVRADNKTGDPNLSPCPQWDNEDQRCPRRFVKGHKPRSVARVFMERFGIAGKKSTAKTIPDPIFRVPNAQLARFLSVFWMCDGYVGARGPEIELGWNA